MFGLRTLFFFRMVTGKDQSGKRMDYFEIVNFTTVGLVLNAISNITLNWVEWGLTWAAFSNKSKPSALKMLVLGLFFPTRLSNASSADKMRWRAAVR